MAFCRARSMPDARQQAILGTAGPRPIFARLGNSLLTVDVVIGTLSFVASPTLSLIPRSYLIQGVLSGISGLSDMVPAFLPIGYGPISNCRSCGGEGNAYRRCRRASRDCRLLLPYDFRLAEFDPHIDGTRALDTANTLRIGAIAAAIRFAATSQSKV